MKRTVLITGARAPVALELARSFAAAGFPSHLADSVPSLMVSWSKTVTQVHRYASPRFARAAFRRDVAALVRRLDPVLIVPTCEEVFHLASAAPELGIVDRLFAPDFATLCILHGKSSFSAACAAIGVDTPATRKLTGAELVADAARFARGLVFKPEFSRFATRALIRPSAQAAARLAPTPSEPWAEQDFVDGREVCFYAVSRGGMLTAFSVYEPTWRLDGGASYAFAPVAGEVAARLRAIAARLAADIVHQGQFSCDAIVDSDDRPWLIECNARATSGAHLFGPGPSLAGAMLGEGEATPSARLRYLGPAMRLFGRAAARKSGRDWRGDMAAGEDVIGAIGDAWPPFGALLDSARFQAAAALSGRSLAAQTTHDIEWNGEPL